MKIPLKTKLGQPSWRLKKDVVELWITKMGGMLAPARFRLSDGRVVQPFAIAPWTKKGIGSEYPTLLQALRGDFFCAPFGGNEKEWRSEKHPPHGETANADWAFVESSRTRDASSMHLRLETKVRSGVVDKQVTVRKGHRAIYCEHTLSGFSGPMSLGTHPCLNIPGEEGAARVSVGGWESGQVLPEAFEEPAIGGYSCLKPGASFESLSAVPLANGGNADLSRYPARSGFDDLVMLIGKPNRSIAWSAVTFPKERWVFLQLKDPSILRHTLLWHSNGGRHYAPWNGEHRNVLGIEETTSYFHYGQAESARANPISRMGYPTTVKLSAKKPLRVPHIFAVAEIPRGFDIVADVRETVGGLELVSENGRTAKMRIDTEFLKS